METLTDNQQVILSGLMDRFGRHGWESHHFFTGDFAIALEAYSPALVDAVVSWALVSDADTQHDRSEASHLFDVGSLSHSQFHILHALRLEFCGREYDGFSADFAAALEHYSPAIVDAVMDQWFD
jgi:hypothetical protein